MLKFRPLARMRVPDGAVAGLLESGTDKVIKWKLEKPSEKIVRIWADLEKSPRKEDVSVDQQVSGMIGKEECKVDESL